MFYSDLRREFGVTITQVIKEWIKYTKKLVLLKCQQKFLHSAKNNGLIPKFLSCGTQVGMSFKSFKSGNKFENLLFNFRFKVLNSTISDKYYEIRKFTYRIAELEKLISGKILYPCFNIIKSNHLESLKKFKFILNKNLIKKIITLRLQQKHKIPCDKSRWLINLTSTPLPDDVSEILSLGKNFSIPYTKQNFPTFDIISSTENSISKCNWEIRDDIRSKVAFHTQNCFYKDFTSSKNDPFDIKNKIIKTKQFISQNKDLVVTNADKGNMTVILKKDDYNNKVSLLLSDTNVYEKINKNPINKIITIRDDMIKKWEKNNWISKQISLHLRPSTNRIARFYGLPKVHKPNIPCRHITSDIGSPLYNLSSFLRKAIHPILGKTSSYVKNSWEFKNNIKNITVPENFIIISLDAVSMFTNISKHRAINCVEKNWDEIKNNTKLDKQSYLEAFKLVLNNSYVQHKNSFYKQTSGVPMGSSISPSVADLVLEDIERDVLPNIPYEVTFFFRYVDDILTCVPIDKFDDFLFRFNNADDNLKFTLEKSINNCINFLDVSIKVVDGRLLTNWYRKPTWSGRYLHFFSHHHISQKIAVVYSLVDRVIKLSEKQYHQENLFLIKNTLSKNGYPQNFLNKFIKKRINYLNQNTNNNLNDRNKFDNNNMLVLPYVESLQNQFKQIASSKNLELIYTNKNKLGHYFYKSQKDPVPIGERSGIVYKIDCKDCTGVYIGESSRTLDTRIKEHKRDVSQFKTNTALSKHSVSNFHNFDFDNSKILDYTQITSKRRILEMLHISSNPKSINLKTDVQNLSSLYHNLIISNKIYPGTQ